jgi:hypothetical protein
LGRTCTGWIAPAFGWRTYSITWSTRASRRGVAVLTLDNPTLNLTTLVTDSHRVFAGPDIEEGVSAFFAKRAPVFTAGRKGVRQGTTQGD